MPGACLLLCLAAVGAHAGGVEGCFPRAVPFTQSGKTPERHYGRGVPCDIRHTLIDLRIDFLREAIEGRVVHRFAPVGAPASEIVLDAGDMRILGVSDGEGSVLAYRYDDAVLTVVFPEPLPPGEEARVEVRYRVERPDRGMHFRTPRMGYAEAETQCWTQGEAEDARYWFPCFDAPTDRASTEVIATVPEGFRAISNGVLQSQGPADAAGHVRFHYVFAQEHPSYLVSLAAGRFSELRAEGGGVPLYYYVLPEHEDEAQVTFGKMPRIMEFMQRRIGMAYPYAQYAQVCVADFIAGGMENTTVTTLTERTLHDEAAHLTYSSDGLLAHELAHQWFGDYVTCRDWSQLWLNEGFATYLELLWAEHDLGVEEFRYRSRANARDVFENAAAAGQPVVQPVYGVPDDLFTIRVYEKAGWVLHMLRRELGDELFWRGVRAYLEAHGNRPVETNDLLRVFEGVSGKGLEAFFDQWLYRGGFPRLEVEKEWLGSRKLAKVTVRQMQPIDAEHPPYRLRATLSFHGRQGERRETIEIREAVGVYHIALEEDADFFCFDPDGDLLAQVTVKQGRDALVAQLERAPSALSRGAAAEGLGEEDAAESVAALRHALLHDSYWGVRADAARALAKVDHEDALGALLEGVQDPEARVRRAVAESLGKMNDLEAARALVRLLQEDPSPYVAADAIGGLETLRAGATLPEIRGALERDSHAQVLRNAALKALGNLGGIQMAGTIAPYAGFDRPRLSRAAALRALGACGRYEREVLEAMIPLLNALRGPNAYLRGVALEALATLGAEGAIPELASFAATTKSSRERDAARKTIEAIRGKRAQQEEIGRLREQVHALEDQNRELGKRLDALEDLVKKLPSE